jgi:hypothetical protein
MFRLFILFVCSLGFISGCSLRGGGLTEYQVPPAVLSAFRLEYPAATDTAYRKFTKRGVKVYAVEFDLGGLRHEVNYTLEGRAVNFEKKDEEPVEPKEEKTGDSGAPVAKENK